MSDPVRSGNGSDAQESSQPTLLRRLAQILRGEGSERTIREKLHEVIEENVRTAPDFSPRERLMLDNLLKFGELRVYDVMVPRADIIAVEEETPLRELFAVFREAQHSRLPIYRETLDDPIGVIHIKDLVGRFEVADDGMLRWPDISIADVRRELLFVPPSMPALDLLVKMQTTRLHLALVIDEYGGTDGLVSIEDLVEEIVGDIDDEHDVDEAPHLRRLPDGSFELDARFDLDDFRDQTGIELKPEDPDEDVDTMGGLAVSLLGRVPLRGEIIRHPSGYDLEVLEADPRRIKRLRVRPPALLTGEAG
ncbi:MAG: CBS domain-containing protein [Alphaproteobacteria bacterium]|nr:CBS domain-containing protein [Alphaproteobacteria bacterium]